MPEKQETIESDAHVAFERWAGGFHFAVLATALALLFFEEAYTCPLVLW